MGFKIAIIRALLVVCLVVDQACCHRGEAGCGKSLIEVSSEAALRRHDDQSHHWLSRHKHTLVNVSTDRGHIVDPHGASTTSYESWGERMKKSLTEVIIGIIALIFSIPILWTGESRNARMASLIARAKDQARTVDTKAAKPGNDNWLVHVPGSKLRAAASVQDARFDVVLKEGCVRLKTEVEVYQVIEHSTKSEKETLGGGKETTTSYTYSEEWSNSYNNSQQYADFCRRVNWKPEGLQLGTETQNCSRVEFGDAYVLSAALVGQCSEFKPIGDLLPQAVTMLQGSMKLRREQDGLFYLRRNSDLLSGNATGRTQIGDCRVRFEYVPEGMDVTVMALQVESTSEERRTFLPYRLIDRGFCCFRVTEEAEKVALRREGEKDESRLAQEAGCPSVLACICCAFNIVMKCCASMFVAQIHHLWMGKLDLETCLDSIELQNLVIKWAGRVLGWFLMYWGLYALFQPVLVLITVIPFLGPLLARFGGALIWILCGVVTITISFLVVGIAFLFYHPVQGAIFVVAAIAVPLFIVSLAKLMQAEAAH